MVLEVLLRQTNFKNNTDLAFQFRLARDLGMTVAELTGKMSSLEFIQWANFYIWEKNERDKAVALSQAESRKKR
jgi:hypothetical protein